MRLHPPGLRGKFVAALLIAAGVPLVVGLVVLETIGYHGMIRERGKMHQMEALTLVQAIQQASNEEGKLFATWQEADSSLTGFLAEQNRELSRRDIREVREETRTIDASWPSWDVNEPRIQATIRNRGADTLREFLAHHPEVAEAIVTDKEGRLVAANEKTSDYDQADEAWWQKGRSLSVGQVWTDALEYDESSRVFSQDVVIPLHDGEAFAGVAKLSVDITSLFRSLGFDGEAKGERWEIVLPDGRILASSRSGYVSLRDRLDEAELRDIQREGSSGTVRRDEEGESRLCGFMTLGEGDGKPRGYVIFSSRRGDVVAPLRRNLAWLGLGSALLVGVCALAGFAFINRRVLRPLEALGRAARSISATARLKKDERGDEEVAKSKRAEAEEDLKRIQQIHTGDEVEALAGDLAVMTSRVLRYHRELEAEVFAKTSLIQEDLEMARQFQNALLPSEYPNVPPAEVEAALRLKFAHFYQPASTVGGDFFDLIELGEDCAGVLIADVMGHGARSALVTAILRALVRNSTEQARNPGAFLGELNQHLHDVIARSGQTLFVTAFFLVLDTRNGKASWAVAGHPAPLRVRRGSGKEPEPLWTEPPRQPALGLVPRVAYRTTESPLRTGDVFLLYTDGAVEAENPAGEAFGVERLAKFFDEALDGPMAAMPAKIVCEVTAFQRRAQYDDDVCLVAVEAGNGGMMVPRTT
ncbi:MAG: SpoIIE family protein phosphatase [Luteolibacter sp.]